MGGLSRISYDNNLSNNSKQNKKSDINQDIATISSYLFKNLMIILYSFILKIVNIGQGYWINRIILGMLYITVG